MDASGDAELRHYPGAMARAGGCAACWRRRRAGCGELLREAIGLPALIGPREACPRLLLFAPRHGPGRPRPPLIRGEARRQNICVRCDRRAGACAADIGERRFDAAGAEVRRLASSSGGAVESTERQRRERPADGRVWTRRVRMPQGRLVRQRSAGPRLRRGGLCPDEAGNA